MHRGSDRYSVPIRAAVPCCAFGSGRKSVRNRLRQTRGCLINFRQPLSFPPPSEISFSERAILHEDTHRRTDSFDPRPRFRRPDNSASPGIRSSGTVRQTPPGKKQSSNCRSYSFEPAPPSFIAPKAPSRYRAAPPAAHGSTAGSERIAEQAPRQR